MSDNSHGVSRLSLLTRRLLVEPIRVLCEFLHRSIEIGLDSLGAMLSGCELSHLVGEFIACPVEPVTIATTADSRPSATVEIAV